MVAVPCSSPTSGSIPGVRQGAGKAAWQGDAGPVLSGAKGWWGAPDLPLQLMGPREHREGREEHGAQVMTPSTFVRVSGARNIWKDN